MLLGIGEPKLGYVAGDPVTIFGETGNGEPAESVHIGVNGDPDPIIGDP